MAADVFSVFYNILLTVVLTLAVCCVFFQYRHYKSPVLIALGTMFGAYLFDNTIVFCTEIIPEFAEFYDKMFLETPSVKTVYFIILVSSLLYVLHCAIPAFTVKQMCVLVFVHAAILICTPMISQHDWMVFVYYFSTQFLVILISAWGLVILRKTESSFDRGMMKRIFLYFLIMSILILVEDSVVIFFLDRFYGPRMKINNRNFSENLLYLGVTWPVFRHTAYLLKNQLYREETDPGEDAPEQEDDKSSAFAFAALYNLTERERQILVHLLQSKSQQEISEELIIALGTVKTHIHNIYQKTDSINRRQILAKYQEFCAGQNSEVTTETV